MHLAITATFTAEPVENTLTFWLEKLGIPHVIQFAPYNQVFQQLLDTQSLFAQNQAGPQQQALNVIYIRLEDWIPGQPARDGCQLPAVQPEANGAEPGLVERTLRQNASDLVNAIKVGSLRSNTRHLLVVCPVSESIASRPELVHILDGVEHYILDQLNQVSRVESVASRQVLASYPVEKIADPNTARAGHVPYTDACYTALATIAVRRFSATSRLPHKVIVLDCDNTLWRGICGEDGAKGVRVTAGFKKLQQFMRAQKEAGMLLCLASKNIEADVDAVFAENENMVLQRSDIVAARVNWQPKSENLRSLAETLNLGLDSFIFIDDNPVECAEVRTSCPQVATFQLPADDADIERFLQHNWLLDRGHVTEEDKKRAAHYQQNVQREQVRSASASLKEYLLGLDLQIDITVPEPAHLPRLAQLTQRTNQFNTTTIRRTETEITDLITGGALQAAAIHVRDRFGDYGLVGQVLYGFSDTALQVDSLILSCRALGRSVEQSMARYLAERAAEKELQHIDIAFSPTARNEPAQIFLDTLGRHEKKAMSQGTIYRYHTADLLEIVPLEAATPSAAASKTTGVRGAGTASAGLDVWQEIADTLYGTTAIQRAVRAKSVVRPALQTPFIEPQSEQERKVTRIWQDVLGIEGIGLDDGFKELGGTSLQLVQIYGRLLEAFDIELPFTRLFGLPTIRAFIDHLDARPDPGNQAQAIKQRAARQKAAMQRKRRPQLNLR